MAEEPQINAIVWHGNSHGLGTEAVSWSIFGTLFGSSIKRTMWNDMVEKYSSNLERILITLQKSNYEFHQDAITVKDVRVEFEGLIRCVCKNNDTWYSFYAYRHQTDAASKLTNFLLSPQGHKLLTLLSTVYQRPLTKQEHFVQLYQDIYRGKIQTDSDEQLIHCQEHTYWLDAARKAEPTP
ncbi:hypothetical protein [Legionella tunisiensis]|uniref:hypothetical protein n=1 Tax=Legionella tunisiensis TaxID=1034944 RepID=UPI000474A0F2|nr:hypothetical protein [Legionella tunisiensis]